MKNFKSLAELKMYKSNLNYQLEVQEEKILQLFSGFIYNTKVMITQSIIKNGIITLVSYFMKKKKKRKKSEEDCE